MAAPSRDEADPAEEGDGGDAAIATVMGFSGFGKRARVFDLAAIFEQTRRTAMERSRGSLQRQLSSSSTATTAATAAATTAATTATSTATTRTRFPLRPEVKNKSSDDDDDDGGGGGGAGGADGGGGGDNDDDEVIGPHPLPREQHSDSDSDDDDEEEDEQGPRLPVSHEVSLRHGVKAVTALAVDPAGARVLSGGADFQVKLWDFAGMDSELRAFRTISPCECHQLKHIAFNLCGDKVLVVSGGATARILDRDGFPVGETAKGDQYITDTANTKGHVAMLTGGCWNPKQREEFMTTSMDGSVRLWDVSAGLKTHRAHFRCRAALGRRTAPTSAAFGRDGTILAAGCSDGSLQIWDKRLAVHTKYLCRSAHSDDGEISGLAFTHHSRHLLSRAGDSVRRWDLRQFKTPLSFASNLPSSYTMSDVCLSPDERVVLAAVSPGRGGQGRVVFLDAETLALIYDIPVSGSGVVRCLWHPKINQVVATTSDGEIRVYYDPTLSQRGAKLCVVKSQRRVRPLQTVTRDLVITPHALPMFREPRARSARKQQQKERQDPVLSHRPTPPMSGHGRGGRVAAHGGTLSSFIVKSIALDHSDDGDARGAILRHAEAARDNPYWVAPAYSRTQPTPIFAEPEEAEEPDDEQPAWKKTKI